MRTVLVAIVLMVQNILAQDSLSRQYLSYVNIYRFFHNLPLLEYDMQLDSLAILRLIESAKGLDDCFEDPNFNGVCKDSIRNLHFKFQTTVDDYHSNHPNTFVTGENMGAIQEFQYFSSSYWLTDKIRITNPITSINCNVPLHHVAETFLDGWIHSPNHNELLLNTKANRCAFRVLRTMHQDKPWIHAIFLAGYND